MNGIIAVNKPKDWTSHDVCNFIRHRFKIKKVGHTGTLDPMATGVLVVLLGLFTKRMKEFVNDDKEYAGTFEMGSATSTQDAQGPVIKTAEWKTIKKEDIEAVFREYTGEIEQLPPMVSAKKINGKRLYSLARKGEEVAREKKLVTVHSLDLVKFSPPLVDFNVCVSKGTYIRTLVNDIGEVSGCFAFLKELKRTRCGKYGIDDCITVEELRKREKIGTFHKKEATTLN